VLLQRLKQYAAALGSIAEIVHNIELKDGKFDRPEVAGIERLITGICSAHKEDEISLARASASSWTCTNLSQDQARAKNTGLAERVCTASAKDR
jgi:hypothetical protein